MEGKHPLSLLREIERRSLVNARGLPQREETHELWHGIGFRIGDARLVAPLTQVNEILHYPRLTTVPGTLAWVKGLANIRGTLLPVMDLRAYLEQPSGSFGSRSRIMVIREGDVTAGLLVDEVMGLKHFEAEEVATRVPRIESTLRPYIQGAFKQSDQVWYVFDMTALAGDPHFLQVAV